MMRSFQFPTFRKLACRFVIVFLFVRAPGHDVSAQTTAQGTKASPSAKLSEPEASLRALVLSGRVDDLRWPVFSDYRIQVDDFYRPRTYKMAWLRDAEPTPRAQAVIEVLQQADDEGLRAEDYDAPRWKDRITHIAGMHSVDDEVAFDVALTVCLMRYVSDLRIGRINPQHFKFGLDVSHKKLDLPQFVRQLHDTNADVKSELSGVEPPFNSYKETRKTLLRYMELAKQDSGEQLPVPPVIAFPGTEYAALPLLARKLRLVGDLPEDAIVPADIKIYDGPLVDAVKRFQDRHGVTPDGYLNRDTIEQINVPLSSRVEQIRLELERYRWLRYNFSQPPIIVNIPEFRLYAFNDKGKIGLTMKVNVGDSYDFQTPVFENSIRYLVFRPYWNVPPKILRNEVIPDIEEDRDYVRNNNMEVVTPGGAVLTAGRISDQVLQQLRAGKVTVREKPGSENALGLLKIIFPNEHHIYLHDTPAGVDMFFGAQRALSHGCIHIEQPAQLAVWLLRDKPGWTLQRVEQAMHEGKDNLNVNLTRPVPIMLLYATVIVKDNGDVHFFRDIYGLDAALEKALAKGYPYPSK